MVQGKNVTVGRMALAAAIAASAAAAPSYAQTRVDPFAGQVDPFAGKVDPFAGNVDPFAGNVDPFGGKVDPFGGTVDPFGKSVDPFKGNVDPFGGNVDPFKDRTDMSSASLGNHWKSFGQKWQAVVASWNQVDAAPTDAVAQTALVQQMQLAFAESESFWGAKVLTKTGKTTKAGVIDPILAKYGASLDNPASLKALTTAQRTRMIYDIYDTLQTYAEIDHVDRWMGQINWNPKLSLTQGGGSDSVIGLLDSRIAGDIDLRNNLAGKMSGYKSTGGGHGAAVMSLMVADYDKKGVQGLAPRAKVFLHNPFDASGTASWTDVTRGINRLLTYNASVINLSMGVKGSTFHQDWKTVFSDTAVASRNNRALYVVAAGNDGISQSTNVDFGTTAVPSMILVGSVDAKNNISSFSNRPGTACILTAGVCGAGNTLADRFIVAPGELTLVSDGNNGITRVSGTSFAAPLVTGTIALLHDRWPWLVNNPGASADIILKSARDLGAAGVDAVYGHGLLDVEASQAPLDFRNLKYFEYSASGAAPVERSVSYVASQMKANAWSSEGAFYYLYETIGSTYRDFAMPMSTRLIGQQTSINGSTEYFQDYVTSRMDDWSNTNGFNDARSISMKTSKGIKLGFQVLPGNISHLDRRAITRMPSPNVRVASENGQLGFSIGRGHGLRLIAQTDGLNLSSDYDASNGGVNPVLGLASGGAFMNADIAVNDTTKLAIGFTENRNSIAKNASLSKSQRAAFGGVEDYQANAINIRLAHKLAAGATLTADYARVREGNGLLGVQSAEGSDLRDGSVTQTATVAASFKMPGKVLLAASATGAVSKSKSNQALTTSGKGVMSSAFAMAVTKTGVLSKRDGLRLSVSQPLHIEDGELNFTSVAVTNRATGELGKTTQTFDISNKSRRLTGELMYATPLFNSGELSLFGRADYRINAADGNKVDGLVIGGRVSLPF